MVLSGWGHGSALERDLPDPGPDGPLPVPRRVLHLLAVKVGLQINNMNRERNKVSEPDFQYKGFGQTGRTFYDLIVELQLKCKVLLQFSQTLVS